MFSDQTSHEAITFMALGIRFSEAIVKPRSCRRESDLEALLRLYVPSPTEATKKLGVQTENPLPARFL